MILRTDNKLMAPGWFSYIYPILFGLAYSHPVLFTSNQNTKFISGLALAGYRDIAADWMAHITDPFPLFSILLKWEYQLFGLHAGVGLSFLLILATYSISSVWIAKIFLSQNKNRPREVLIFSLFWLLIHAVNIRSLWLHFIPDGLGGQYMIGPYYQPCGFGVLLLTSTAAYTSKRLTLSAICLVLAPLFHPAYLITSIIIAIAIIILPANRFLALTWKKRLLFLSFIILILSIYAVWLSDLLTVGDPSVRAKAHQLLAEVRIPHHALPSKWSLLHTLEFFIVGFAAAWLGRKWLIGQLLFVALLVAGAAVFLASVHYNPTLAVVAPWRVSVFLAPLSWIILLTVASKWFSEKIARASFNPSTVLKIGSTIAVVAVCLAGVLNSARGNESKMKEEYYPISHFLIHYHEPGNQYLVPLDQTNIRLEAGVPVFATWKSHPSKDSEFIEWYKRTQIARAIYERPTEVTQSAISLLINKYSVTHVIWPISQSNFPFWVKCRQVYSDSYFSLWDIRGCSENFSGPTQ